MLLFRSEETVDLWCDAHKIPRRPLINLDQLWQLAVTWYGNRLTIESRRPAPDEMMSIFASIGLTGPFWAMEVTIRSAAETDRDAIWKIFHEVVASGDTYPFDPKISREKAFAYWFQPGGHAYVAELDCLKQSSLQEDHCLVGTYILRPNQSGGGAHVANAAFMVPTAARGQGIGRAMGEHCLSEARRLGFRAMQFNFVVSTNESAVKPPLHNVVAKPT